MNEYWKRIYNDILIKKLQSEIYKMSFKISKPTKKHKGQRY